MEAFKTADPPVSIESVSGKRIVLEDPEIQAVRRGIAAFYHNSGIQFGTAAGLPEGVAVEFGDRRGQSGGLTLEDLDRAILAYRRALEFDPDRMVTAGNLVAALAAAGRLTEAVNAALQAAEGNPEAPSGILVTASFGLVASGRLDEAIDYCHRALKGGSAAEVQPEMVFRIYGGILNGKYGSPGSSACTRMGMDLWDGGRAQEAVRAFRQALERDADNRRAHFGLGLALLAQGQVEEAGRLYAEGVARFGRAAAEESGAAEGIRSLIARGIQAEAAREILTTYWPER